MTYVPRNGLTPHEHRIVEALIEEGRVTLVARRLELAESTVKNALAIARKRVGVVSNVQLVYALATADDDAIDDEPAA